MARCLMIQGTGSGAGKSLIAAALCRILSDLGYDVAPFKAQNMALNSFITIEGGEIGRAQALQAEAARIEPTVDMNPILLKASGEMGSQVIIQGRIHGSMKAKDYYAIHRDLRLKVRESFDRLASRFDVVILEGAGSPAEINLLKVDLVNMAMAREAKAPVILVGDIDKGGVFASLLGTIKLLGRQAGPIKGLIINKFRGDRDILDPGLAQIEEKTRRPVLGVIPYFSHLNLPEEDSLSLACQRWTPPGASENETVRVVVVRLPYLSNFTDFDPLLAEDDVELIYSANRSDLATADLIILPGTKKTACDLAYLRLRGLDEALLRAVGRGVGLIGICGGFQMMGRKIFDPAGVEGENKEVEGLGILEVESVFQKVKITSRCEGRILDPEAFGLAEGGLVTGYEIHMGTSTGDLGLFELTRLSEGEAIRHRDGSRSGNAWGTYLHGIFENDFLRRAIINQARSNKGLPPLKKGTNYRELKERSIETLARLVRENVNLESVLKIMKL